jgi:hypothetical protein
MPKEEAKVELLTAIAEALPKLDDETLHYIVLDIRSNLLKAHCSEQARELRRLNLKWEAASDGQAQMY